MPESEINGGVGGTAADVHHHVAAGLGDGQTGANGGHHRLLHQVHFFGFGNGGALENASRKCGAESIRWQQLSTEDA